MVRKIVDKVPDEQLLEDLEKYLQRALELGATKVKIIPADMVVIDERVRAKCLYPKCSGYGTNVSCPPYAIDLDITRKIASNFRWAVFVSLATPSGEMAGAEAKEKIYGIPWRLKLYEIVSKIEAEAFYDGYHLALGFACGSCKGVFCRDIDCTALVPGQRCRLPLRSRSSMEAVGMDTFIMAARVGWDVYPIGASLAASDVPCGMLLGLVLIT